MLGLLYWKLKTVSRRGRSDEAKDGLDSTLKRDIGPNVRTLGTVVGAAAAMGLVMAWLLSLLGPAGTPSLSNDILRIVVGGGGGALAYAGALLLVRQPEAWQLYRAALRLGRLERESEH